MKIVTVSSKGQITIPVELRKKTNAKHYAFMMKGNTIILQPLKIEPIKDPDADFGLNSEEAFAFWNNNEDDIYEKFYGKS